MSKRNKDKGNELERYTRDALLEHGIQAWRPKAGYPKDIGDVLLPEFNLTLQCKWVNVLAEGVNQALSGAAVQSEEACLDQPGSDSWFGAGVVHRSRRPMGESIVVFTLDEFTQFMQTVRRQ